MIDKNDNLADRRISYRSPEVKEICVIMPGVLCGSGETEKYGMSGNSYNEGCWE